MNRILRRAIANSLIKEAVAEDVLRAIELGVPYTRKGLLRTYTVGGPGLMQQTAKGFRLWPWLAVGGAGALAYGAYKQFKKTDPYAQYYGLGKLGERLLLMRLLGF